MGDFAIFMIQNNLDEKSIFERGKTFRFSKSVVDFFAGDLGQPVGGFLRNCKNLCLKVRSQSQCAQVV